jgi:UDP-N-acetylglucosamine 2-epimerase
MRIVSVVGARPQFVKLAVICRALNRYADAEHCIIHTGQHYDDAMSGTFFRDLSIPQPSCNLAVGSGTHGQQTAEMMCRLEPVLACERPDWVLLYGDTNSTAAAAMTAAKMHFRMAHIEAGLRSFNRQMPEEINRIVADHLSDLLLCPSAASIENLRREGLHDRAVLTGDVMFDAVLEMVNASEDRSDSPAYRYPQQGYAVATVHRAENTEDMSRLRAILYGLERISQNICPVLLVAHPRTAKMMSAMGWEPRHVNIMPPVPYPDMLLLERRARMIITDSGGVQKEAYFLRIPCITVREETEWVETLENSCNAVVGSSDPDRIYAAADQASSAGPWKNPYGTGTAGVLIADCLMAQPNKGLSHP